MFYFAFFKSCNFDETFDRTFFQFLEIFQKKQFSEVLEFQNFMFAFPQTLFYCFIWIIQNKSFLTDDLVL